MMRRRLWSRRASWLVATALLAGLLAIYLAAVAWAPHHLVDQELLQDPRTTPGDRLDAEQGARLLVTSIAGALVVLGGLIFTGVNYRLSRRGQITDRFSKALERLTSAQPYGRIGGIHALERVMHDSPGHLNDVIAVLAAFIREHAPAAQDEPPEVRRRGWRRRQRQHPGADTRELPARPALDVQAALTALGRRPRHGNSPLASADLSNLHLRGARLDDLNLRGIIFDGADLRDAQFENADLRGAQLNWASLRRAALNDADARGARFTGADLREAGLVGTDLRTAVLGAADMRGARLGHRLPRFLWTFAGANPDRPAARLIWGHRWGYVTTAAKLRGALLGNADLRGAMLAGVDLRHVELKNANTAGAQLEFNHADVNRNALEIPKLTAQVLGVHHDAGQKQRRRDLPTGTHSGGLTVPLGPLNKYRRYHLSCLQLSRHGP
jgi:uncharacterized protein YjbI with pentapeptide repeats